ncbi:unnamed protein product [Heligmosomoides polygyrus]|uniref:Reverse transcriptase domain-containing protein n=1 Tax=Heligmosomoides polygyrus TaxID=6339 RepID=A0A183FM77_HELPZ|nr:unnamed protein product [Heligmosomoides polygyrus]
MANCVCGNAGLQLNLTKTTFMNGTDEFLLPHSRSTERASPNASYVYLGREVNMANDLATELGRRKRAAWGPSKIKQRRWCHFRAFPLGQREVVLTIELFLTQMLLEGSGEVRNSEESDGAKTELCDG